jgi:hypothetical protein
MSTHWHLLNTTRPRRILIPLQLHQHFPHPRLTAPRRPTRRPLSTQIRQLSDALPARSASGGILPLGQELDCFLGGLRLLLVCLAVVGLVEGVDVFAGGGDCFVFLLLGGFVAAGEVGRAFGAPFGDGGRVSGVGGGWVVVGVGGGGGVGYGTAGADVLGIG